MPFPKRTGRKPPNSRIDPAAGYARFVGRSRHHMWRALAGPEDESRDLSATRHGTPIQNVSGLGQHQCVLGVHAKIAHRALEIDMAERHLHSPWIARPLVDQRHLRPLQAVCALGTPAQADVLYLIANQSGIFARADVIRAVRSGSGRRSPDPPPRADARAEGVHPYCGPARVSPSVRHLNACNRVWARPNEQCQH